MSVNLFYEGVSADGSTDFIVSKQGEELIADIFDNRISNPERAYITTECYDNLEDAIKDLKCYALL